MALARVSATSSGDRLLRGDGPRAHSGTTEDGDARGRAGVPDGAAQLPLPRAARGGGDGAGTRASPDCARAKPSVYLRSRQRALAEPGILQALGSAGSTGRDTFGFVLNHGRRKNLYFRVRTISKSDFF